MWTWHWPQTANKTSSLSTDAQICLHSQTYCNVNSSQTCESDQNSTCSLQQPTTDHYCPFHCGILRPAAIPTTAIPTTASSTDGVWQLGVPCAHCLLDRKRVRVWRLARASLAAAVMPPAARPPVPVTREAARCPTPPHPARQACPAAPCAQHTPACAPAMAAAGGGGGWH
jgi:hypothetical protein